MPAKKSTASKRGAPKAPENETPEARFSRVAGGRLAKALSAIDSIGKAAQSKIMVYNKAQADRILEYLGDAITDLEAILNAPPVKASGGRVVEL